MQCTDVLLISKIFYISRGFFVKMPKISTWIFKWTLEDSSLTHLLFATKCYLKYLVWIFYFFSALFFYLICLFACFWRFYDLLSGTTVWGMGPVFQHEAVSDNAWPPGTEQGKLEGSAEGTVGQRWRCWPHFWGNGLRHFTSGTSIVLTSISMTKLPLPSVSARLDSRRHMPAQGFGRMVKWCQHYLFPSFPLTQTIWPRIFLSRQTWT